MLNVPSLALEFPHKLVQASIENLSIGLAFVKALVSEIAKDTNKLSMNYQLTPFENWIFQYTWRLLPQGLRARFSRVILFFQRRAAIRIPQTLVSVYAFSPQTQTVFHQAVSLMTIQVERNLPCSLITSCLNESATIIPWLESLGKQSVLPTETIICDGGSTDNTVALINAWKDAHPEIALQVFSAPGSNIARGRNLAIERAAHPCILMTDVGCVLESRWAERLLLPFVHQPSTEVVMGWYEPLIQNGLLEHVAHFIVPKLEQIDLSTFLPSGRSLAMKKVVWQESGGFPEFLSLAGEDSLFDYQWKLRVQQIAFCPDAVVLWKFPATTRQALRTIVRYAQGDAEGGTLFWAHYVWLIRTSFVVLVSGLFGILCLAFAENIVLLLIGVVCSIYSLHRLSRMFLAFSPFTGVKKGQAFKRLVALGIVIVGQVTGFLRGLLRYSKVQQKKQNTQPAAVVVDSGGRFL